MSEQLIAGRYRIEHELGQGGMGAVYLGTDTLTGLQVAIKVMKPELVKTSPEAVQRFAREAEALRKLNHPNIVKVLATAEEDDNHYIVMEYVRGGSLQDLLDETPRLPVERVTNIALDLADALTRAHRLKIVHRDIKPANVLLAEDGTPRLTDFGVARMEDTTRMTKTGNVVGTLAYLPPEALNGEPFDERGDIWAFGIMLYEMLAGQCPFHADNTGAMLVSIMNDPTPDIFQFRDDIPWTLMGLVYWMLEKDPEKRPPGTRLIGALLENILSGKQLPLNWFEGAGTPPLDSSITPTREQVVKAVKDYTTAAFQLDSLKPSTPSGGTEMKTVVPPPSEQTPVPSSSSARSRVIPAVIGAAVLLVVVIGFLLVSSLNPSLPALTAIPATELVFIAPPLPPGDYSVLVMQFEHVGGAERDVQRFVVEDLRQQFEEDHPYTKIHVYAYPAVPDGESEVRMIADQNKADVVIWGTYDDEEVIAEIQMGAFSNYPNIPVTEEAIRKVTDARVTLTSERRQTLAYNVLAVLSMTTPMNNEMFPILRNNVMAGSIQTPPAEVSGTGIAAGFHRYFLAFIPEPEKAIAEITAAIRLEANNPILYLARALGYQRIGNFEKVREDVATAESFGGKGWMALEWIKASDAFFFRQDFARAVEIVTPFIESRPDDWYPAYWRGAFYYLMGDYDAAGQDLYRSVELKPEANFAYVFAIGVALRQGDFARAIALFDEVRREFPDPTFTERMLRQVVNEAAAQSGLVAVITAFGNLTLRQWREVLAGTEAAVAADLPLSDVYFMRGFAYCNIKDYSAAEAAYSRGIELEPDNTLLYLMRAEVRQKQGNLLGAGADTLAVGNSPRGAAFAPLIRLAASGQLSCETFLDLDVSALVATENP